VRACFVLTVFPPHREPPGVSISRRPPCRPPVSKNGVLQQRLAHPTPITAGGERQSFLCPTRSPARDPRAAWAVVTVAYPRPHPGAAAPPLVREESARTSASRLPHSHFLLLSPVQSSSVPFEPATPGVQALESDQSRPPRSPGDPPSAAAARRSPPPGRLSVVDDSRTASQPTPQSQQLDGRAERG
jgi:hypothetical protein